MVYSYISISPTWPTAAKFEEEDPQETDLEESIAALEVSQYICDQIKDSLY